MSRFSGTNTMDHDNICHAIWEFEWEALALVFNGDTTQRTFTFGGIAQQTESTRVWSLRSQQRWRLSKPRCPTSVIRRWTTLWYHGRSVGPRAEYTIKGNSVWREVHTRRLEYVGGRAFEGRTLCSRSPSLWGKIAMLPLHGLLNVGRWTRSSPSWIEAPHLLFHHDSRTMCQRVTNSSKGRFGGQSVVWRALQRLPILQHRLSIVETQLFPYGKSSCTVKDAQHIIVSRLWP